MVQVTLSVRFDNALHMIDGDDWLSKGSTSSDKTKSGSTL
jgi:hypothetical protein